MGPTSGRPHSHVSVRGFCIESSFQTVLMTRPVNGSSGEPLTASTIEGIPPGASTVMNVPAETEDPVVLKFRVLVEVNDPELEFVRLPLMLPVIVIVEAVTPLATTGREKLSVSTFVKMSKLPPVTCGESSACGNGKDVLTGLTAVSRHCNKADEPFLSNRIGEG